MKKSRERATVTVIGAGLAGTVCARRLASHGVPVRLLDKGRGPGGRMSTRRTRDGLAFDHGAQYFTVSEPRFASAVRRWLKVGLVAPWSGFFASCEGDGSTLVPEIPSRTRYVGTPRMSALVRDLQEGLSVNFGARVQRLRRADRGWEIQLSQGGQLVSDHVVVATPAPQAVALLDAIPALAERVARARLAPCMAAMVSFREPLDIPFDAIRCKQGPLAWAAREGSKPGRSNDERWVLHASPQHSRGWLEIEPARVARSLILELGWMVGELPRVEAVTAHRWRYARVEKTVGADHLWDAESGLGYCGDACGGPRIEAAFLSGLSLGTRLGALLGGPRNGDGAALAPFFVGSAAGLSVFG